MLEHVRRKSRCCVSSGFVGTQDTVYVLIPVLLPTRRLNAEQSKQCSCSRLYKNNASWVSGSKRYIGYLRSFHQFLRFLGRKISCVVRLHPNWSAMPCKPLVQKNLCSCLSIILVMSTWDRLCNLGEVINDY